MAPWSRCATAAPSSATWLRPAKQNGASMPNRPSPVLNKSWPTSRDIPTAKPERSHARPQAAEPTGPHREGEKPKPMMHGHEKSDSAIVAAKPPNKAGRPAAEAVEREREPMPHVPDTVPGKRVPGAGARTEGRGQPSNIRGGSRMQESCTYGSVRGAPSNGRPYRNRENGYPSESSGFVYLPETVRVSSKDLPTSGTEVSNPLPSSGESHKLEQQHDLRGRTASGGGHPW